MLADRGPYAIGEEKPRVSLRLVLGAKRADYRVGKGRDSAISGELSWCGRGAWRGQGGRRRFERRSILMDTEAILERRRLRRRASFWRISAFVILAVALLVGIGVGADLAELDGVGGQSQVADIKVDGFITTRPAAVDLIEKATKDKSVKAILLHIDSGGGAASGGEALYKSIRQAAGTKPVVAVIDGLGASAAYMTAIAADYVVARESAITGSIGVIFQYGHVEELLQKIGVEYSEIKSAPLKGEPSLFHEPPPAAEAMLKKVIDDTYEWFVGLVAERRKLPLVTARQLADGSIYSGRQALRLKLIDAVGGDPEARAWLASEKGVSSDLPLKEWKRDESFLAMFQENALVGIARLLGLDAEAASLLSRRLAVDGLLSVWQATLFGRSDR
jgi:protease-4